MKFNKYPRVNSPSILHFCHFGYEYISLKNAHCNQETNSFPILFFKKIQKLTNDFKNDQAKRLLNKVSILSFNEDFRKSFYERILHKTSHKIIENRSKNQKLKVFINWFLPMLMNIRSVL